MKTVAENYAVSFQGSDRSADGPVHDVLLDRIGETLREIYSATTESEQPRVLLALAQKLDARRGPDGSTS